MQSSSGDPTLSSTTAMTGQTKPSASTQADQAARPADGTIVTPTSTTQPLTGPDVLAAKAMQSLQMLGSAAAAVAQPHYSQVMSPTSAPQMLPDGMITSPRQQRRAFRCEYENCQAAFSNSTGLRYHVSVRHTGIKPFACTYNNCGKTFAQKSTLVEHLRTHTGEKPFGCPEAGCTGRFAQKSTLIKHLRTHSREKPYSCDIPGCGASFTQSGSLHKHKRVHHNQQAGVRRPGTETAKRPRAGKDHPDAYADVIQYSQFAGPAGVLPVATFAVDSAGNTVQAPYYVMQMPQFSYPYSFPVETQSNPRVFAVPTLDLSQTPIAFPVGGRQ